MDKSSHIKPDKKYCTYCYDKPGGEGQQEVVTIIYPPCYTLGEIMHKTNGGLPPQPVIR